MTEVTWQEVVAPRKPVREACSLLSADADSRRSWPRAVPGAGEPSRQRHSALQSHRKSEQVTKIIREERRAFPRQAPCCPGTGLAQGVTAEPLTAPRGQTQGVELCRRKAVHSWPWEAVSRHVRVSRHAVTRKAQRDHAQGEDCCGQPCAHSRLHPLPAPEPGRVTAPPAFLISKMGRTNLPSRHGRCGHRRRQRPHSRWHSAHLPVRALSAAAFEE